MKDHPPTNSHPSPVDSGTQRPSWIIALCVLTTLISLSHLLRFILVLSNWQILEQLPLKISPLYLNLDGIIWGTAGVVLTWGLWQGSSSAWIWTQVLALLYAAACWADLLWAAPPSLQSTRWPLNLLLTILGLGFVYFTLYMKASQEYFNR